MGVATVTTHVAVWGCTFRLDALVLTMLATALLVLSYGYLQSRRENPLETVSPQMAHRYQRNELLTAILCAFLGWIAVPTICLSTVNGIVLKVIHKQNSEIEKVFEEGSVDNKVLEKLKKQSFSEEEKTRLLTAYAKDNIVRQQAVKEHNLLIEKGLRLYSNLIGMILFIGVPTCLIGIWFLGRNPPQYAIRKK